MTRPMDIDELLQHAEAGSDDAVAELLQRHRSRLRRMVAVRIDPRLSARVDPSDIVQESLVEAAQQLPAYLKQRPLPFYPWLRQLAWSRLAKFHRHHIHVQKRTINREISDEMMLSDQSAVQLASQLSSPGPTPSGQLQQIELAQRVRDNLNQLGEPDREVLVLWYLEQLTANEIGPILNMTMAGVKSRHRRALQRLIALMNRERGSSGDA